MLSLGSQIEEKSWRVSSFISYSAA